MDNLDKIIAESRRTAETRGHSYREQALKMFPWICGKCKREFTRENIIELTVHHKDHNHDYNPPDGSNWELLCVYCHDHEHQKYDVHGVQMPRRYGHQGAANTGSSTISTSNELERERVTWKPFAKLKELLKK